MQITQISLLPVAILDTPSYPEDIDEVNLQFPVIIGQINTANGEVMVLRQQVSELALQVSIDAAQTAKDVIQTAKDATAAVDAKNVILGYVIPTEATYSPDTIEAKIDMAETLTLTGAL